MGALTLAVVRHLVRGGWLAGLVVLEAVLLAGFWSAGPLPFGEAFDRRAAEADLLLLALSSLPALLAGALLASGDREDGMSDFYRACRLGPGLQTLGTGLALILLLGGALLVAVPLSLALTAPAALTLPGVWTGLLIAVVSTGVHAAWGLALGSWAGSRLAAMGAALAFWVLLVFVAEPLFSALVAALPPRSGMPVLFGFVLADPAQLARVVSVFARGQAWAYGPVFQEAQAVFATVPGLVATFLLAVVHLGLPALLATAGLARRLR